MIFFNIILTTIIVIPSAIAAYLFLVFLGTIIPVNRNFVQQEKGFDIFVKSDGIHADILLPCINSLFDWRTVIPNKDFDMKFSSDNYLGFGWGDRGFFLEIPTWSDLTVKIAAKAMLIPSDTVMHVTAFDEIPDFKYVSKITITEKQYMKIVNYILSCFEFKNGKIDLLEGVGYTTNDNFYEANGKYHAFNTCNYWVNKALIKGEIKTSLWSPSARGIFLYS